MTKKLNFEWVENLIPAGEETGSTNHRQMQILKRVLWKVIQEQLSERQRQILILYFLEQKNQPEIAQLLGINKSTVCRTLNRAIQNVRRYLQYYQFR